MANVKSVRSISIEEAKSYGDDVYLNYLMIKNNISPLAYTIIDEDFYWQYLSKTNLKDYISSLILNIDLIKSKGLNEILTEIQEAIKNTEIPYDLIEDIKDGYEILGYNIKKPKIISLLMPHKKVPCVMGVSINKNGFSNDALESIPRYINIIGIERLKDLIVMIYSSFFSKKIIEEKKKLNIPLLDPLGPVYLQRLIYAEKSGYIYLKQLNSKDLIIEAVPGMIFSLNNKETTPDKIVYDLKDSEIKETELGYKDQQYVYDPKTETIQKKEFGQPEKLILNDDEITKIVSKAKRLFNYIDKPIKIEFSIQNNILFFNNAKYITDLNDSQTNDNQLRKEVFSIIKSEENANNNLTNENMNNEKDTTKNNLIYDSNENVIVKNNLNKNGGIIMENQELDNSKKDNDMAQSKEGNVIQESSDEEKQLNDEDNVFSMAEKETNNQEIESINNKQIVQDDYNNTTSENSNFNKSNEENNEKQNTVVNPNMENTKITERKFNIQDETVTQEESNEGYKTNDESENSAGNINNNSEIRDDANQDDSGFDQDNDKLNKNRPNLNNIITIDEVKDKIKHIVTKFIKINPNLKETLELFEEELYNELLK